MAALNEFVRSGKVRYIGCSNFTAAADRGGPVGRAARGRHAVRQPPAASTRSVARRIESGDPARLPAARARHAGLVAPRRRRAHRPLPPRRAPEPTPGCGRLIASPIPGARTWAEGFLNKPNLAIAGHVAEAAAELGVAPAAVALAWVRSRPEVTSVIVGPRTLDQLRGDLAGLEHRPAARGCRSPRQDLPLTECEQRWPWCYDTRRGQRDVHGHAGQVNGTPRDAGSLTAGGRASRRGRAAAPHTGMKVLDDDDDDPVLVRADGRPGRHLARGLPVRRADAPAGVRPATSGCCRSSCSSCRTG